MMLHRRRSLFVAALAALSFGTAGNLLAQYSINSASIPGIPAAAPGVTFTISGNLPTFSTTTYELCTYIAAAPAATATPLVPTIITAGAVARVTIPASYIQAVPPSAFGANPPAADLYVVPAGSTCNGTYDPTLTTEIALSLRLPIVTLTSATNLPLPNPSETGAPTPVRFTISGQFFATDTVVDIQGLPGGTITVTPTYETTNALLVTMPAIPAGATTATLQVRSVGPLGNYLAANTPGLTFYILQNSALSNLTLTPNPVNAGFGFTSSVTATPAQSPSPQSAGVPTGPVALSEGGSTYASPALKLSPSTAALNQTLLPANVTADIYAQAIADLNGDGLPDVVFVAFSTDLDQMVAYTNLASYPRGQMAPVVQTGLDFACTYVSSIALADVTGDGVPDLVANCAFYSNAGGVIEVYPGYGDGTFNPNFTTVISGTWETALAVGNFSHSGLNDILLGGLFTSANPGPFGLALYKNLGGGTFSTTPVSTSFKAGALVGFTTYVADLNNDGYPDVLAYVVGDTAAPNISVFLNRQDGTFGDGKGNNNVQLAVQANASVSGVTVADVNQDGLPDVIAGIASDPSAIDAYLNTSSGGTESFAPFVASSFAYTPQALAVADFDGDGFLDAAVGSPGGIFVLSGDGKGDFAQNDPAFSYTTLPADSAVAAMVAQDLNGDSYPDLTAALFQNLSDNESFSGATYVVEGPATAATSTFPALPAGTYTIDANYAGDQNFSGSTTNANLIADGIPTTTTLAAIPTPVTYGTKITMTATVVPTISGGVAPSGIMNFLDGKTVLASVTVNGSGVASFSTTALAVGIHFLSATYVGDAYNLTSKSAQQAVTVNPATLTVAANNLSKQQGTVNPTLTYTITGFVNGDTQATATTGQPSLTTTATTNSPVGSYPITITAGTLAANNYTFTFVNGSLTVSAGLTLTSITPNSGYVDDPSTTITAIGTAFIAGDTVQINGTAVSTTFVNGTTLTATIPASYFPTVGTLQVNVLPPAGAVSNSLPYTITLVPTTTNLTVAPMSPAYGQTVTLQAQLLPKKQNATPSAMYSFYDGTTLLGTASLTNDIATFKLVPAVGKHIYHAVYPGDAVYATSTSANTNQTVTAAVLTVTANNLSKQQGAANPALTYTITGFVNGDTQASATTGQPSLTTTATTSSPAGTYPITITQGTLAAANYTLAFVNGTLTIGIPFALQSISPNSVYIGAAATTISLTGSGFASRDVVQVNGTAISTSYLSSTSLSAIIPAADLKTPATLEITVFDPQAKSTVGPLPFTVGIPPVNITFTGPTSGTSGEQPVLNLQLINPYPVDLTATLTLTFTPDPKAGVDDPAIQFSTGGRIDTFVIPANTTITPTIQLQTGTVAGTIDVTLTLAAGSIDVTPAGLQPVTIGIVEAAPVITGMSLTRDGDTLTVIITGYSNIRNMQQASFTFFPAPGVSFDDSAIQVTAGPIFGTWYTSAPSDQYGSEFTYTQQFGVSSGATAVQSVTATLTNSVGSSGSESAQ